ncbi:polysaccharide deacetylase family protein [Litorihabitans aurantiacus]|uniref:NodB homology domain-containing protein n=1 Tax=Litorihabitans aurantiacus TaxID=1930061 RepID=A0AA37UVP0_9MICO|nr:polysaccharide deacetylase family protein [Litorihabitans aurantiacus]GMA31341.1 hypothetical protein GCM10025875_13330 [Litorihabitans aurantiacus]
MRGRLRNLSIACATALALTACTPAAPPPEEDSGPPPTSPTPTSSPGQPIERIAAPSLSDELVPGLELVSETDEDLRIYTQHAVVPGAEDLSAALADYASQAREAYLPVAESAVEAGDVENLPDLNVRPALVGSAPDVLGVRMTTYQFSEDTGTANARTWWVDGGDLLDSADLFATPEAFTEFGDLVMADLEARELGPWAPDDEPTRQLTSITFTDGDPVAELPAGALTAAAAGSLTVRIPAGELLSDAGRRAAAAVADPQPYDTGQVAPTSPPQESTPPPSASPTDDPPSSDVDCAQVACVALTYDDGPSASLTPQLLDVLAERGVPATFFLLGSSVESHPGVAARIAQEGHEIANHTFSHRDLTNLDPTERAAEIADTTAAIESATGVTPTLVRPPYGAQDDAVVAESGMVVVTWDVDTEDWSNRDAAVTTDTALAGVEAGSIILMHDIHPSTIEAAPGLIDALEAEGYTLVTVSDILAPLDPAPGTLVSRGAS